jgi:hypothetical protein
VYEQLADAFAHAKDKVIVAKTDADGVGKPLGQKYGVTGYPSTLLILGRLGVYIDGSRSAKVVPG